MDNEPTVKKTINSADAWRLAQATELLKARAAGVNPPLDAEGKIIPSQESLEEINRSHVVSDQIPPQHTKDHS
jgi:hypothetical protein